jgi:hypothetical protein
LRGRINLSRKPIKSSMKTALNNCLRSQPAPLVKRIISEVFRLMHAYENGIRIKREKYYLTYSWSVIYLGF